MHVCILLCFSIKFGMSDNRTEQHLVHGREINSTFSSGRGHINLHLEEARVSLWTYGKMRGHGEGGRGLGGLGVDDEKGSLFLWCVAMTRIIHNGTWLSPGHGGRRYQNKRLRFTYIMCPPPHQIKKKERRRMHSVVSGC